MKTSDSKRVLFVSGELIAGDLAYRLKREGCEVKLFVAHPEQRECLEGFVEKTSDWKKELDWVGREGLIVFDDVGYGEDQERLRADGYRVFGGSKRGDRLEKERGYADTVLEECGFETVPIFDFEKPAEAIAFVKEHPKTWVVKQNNHQSALNYVGQLSDGSDVLSILSQYERLGVTDITLQEKIEGVEIGVARYFNGQEWVGPIEINVEHKSLFPGNIGPKTGEMGTLMWYDSNEENKLFQATLAKLKSYLQNIDFRGDVDISMFVTEKRIIPIELTARLGCPSTHLQGVIQESLWYEFLGAVADGKLYDLQYSTGFGAVLTLALPPFPYEGEIAKEYSSVGLEVLFTQPLTLDELRRLHYEGVRWEMVDEKEHIFVAPSIGYTLFVSGLGETIEDSLKQMYSLARKIIIPKAFYRNDIGRKFVDEDLPRLKQWGWL